MTHRTRIQILGAVAATGVAWLMVVHYAGCGNAEPYVASEAGALDAGDADLLPDGPFDAHEDPDGHMYDVTDVTPSDVSSDADATWLGQEGWTQVVDGFDWLSPCILWTADLNTVAVPGLNWVPCGDGCEEADLTAGVTLQADTYSSGAIVDDVPIAHIVFGLKGTPPESIARLVRLDTGAVLGAHRFKHMMDGGYVQCGVGSRDHPLLLVIDGPKPGEQGLLVADSNGSWTTIPGPHLGHSGFLAYLNELPGLASNNGQIVSVSNKLDPLEFQVIFNGSNGPARARDRQLVFVDWRGVGLSDGNHGAIQSWSPDVGLQVLLAPPYDPITIALSSTRMVWISFPEMLDYYPDGTTMKPRFHWSPRASVTGELQSHDGAEIPKSPPLIDWSLKTHGDYAAIVAPSRTFSHDEWHTAVTNLSTGELWMIKARHANHVPILVFAVSGSHVYVAEGAHPQGLKVLVRYEIDSLNALATE